MKVLPGFAALIFVACAVSPKPVVAPTTAPPPPCVETTAEIVPNCPKTIVAEYPNSLALMESGPVGSAMTCDFRVTGFAGIDKHGTPLVEPVRESSPMIVTYIDLNSERPLMKGTLGEETLHKVRDDGDVAVMLERTAAGQIVVISISRSMKLAIISKAYFFPVPGGGYSPTGMTTIGRCW